MRILVAVVILTVLALVGSRRALVPERAPFATRMIFTGTEFIVIGLLLGSGFLDLIDELTLDRLRPFVCVALGWIGFLFGLQFDRRTLSHLPAGFVAISTVVGLVTLGVVFPPMWYLLRARLAPLDGGLLLAAITLAAAAACTGQSTVALVARRGHPSSRHVMTLLRYVSSLDSAVGVVAIGFALTLAGARPLGPDRFPQTLQWLVIAACLGALMAWIFVSLTLTRTSQAELVLYLLGVIALSSGVAFALGLSVLFVNFVCGVTVANLATVRSIRGRVMSIMERGEHFIYLLLLVIAGAYWQLPTPWVLVVALIYIALRLAGKLSGAFLATRGFARQHRTPALVGLGLVSQAGMAVAIIIDYRLVADITVADLVIGIALTAVVLTELLAPWLTLRVARRSEEAHG
jgi:hypothetical protein